MNKDDLTGNEEWDTLDDWVVQKNSETDENGWKYAVGFFTKFTKNMHQLHSVRKRVWIKKLTKWF